MPETSKVPFAVFGATGQQGGAVVDALLDRGASVRAILRDLGSDTDRRARFRWLVETPAYQADFDTTKRIDVDLLDLTTWLRRNR